MAKRRGSERVDLAVSPAQKERWGKAAQANGTSLSEWIRQACDDTADRLFPRQAVNTRTYARSSDCPRWMYHTVGVYCSGCDTVIPG